MSTFIKSFTAEQNAELKALITKIKSEIHSMLKSDKGYYYIRIADNNGEMNLISLYGEAFQTLVITTYEEQTSKPYDEKILDYVRNAIIATTEYEEVDSFKRFHFDKKYSKLVYQLNNQEIVYIDSNGISIQKNLDYIFNNEPGYLPQVYPDLQIGLAEFHEKFDSLLPTLDDEQKAMYKIYAITALFEPSMPIIQFYGPVGCSKTTLANFLKSILSPSSHPNTSADGRDSAHLKSIINSSKFVILDNMAKIDNYVANILCLSYSKRSAAYSRKVNTTNLLVPNILDAMIALTTNTQLYKTYDLVDRSLTFKIEDLLDKKTDEHLLKQADECLPSIMGGIFNVVYSVLNFLETKQIDVHSYVYPDRLASYLAYSRVVAYILGYDVIWYDQLFKRMREYNRMMFIDARCPEIGIIDDIFNNNQHMSILKLAPQEFLEKIIDNNYRGLPIVEYHGTITKQLKKYEYILNLLGYEFDHDRNGARYISIKRK